MDKELSKAIESAKKIVGCSTLVSAFKYKGSYILQYRDGPEYSYTDFDVKVDRKGNAEFFDFIVKFYEGDKQLLRASEKAIHFNEKGEEI